MSSDHATAPWTEDQVESLNAYQHSGVFHEYTGWQSDVLVATTEGWISLNDPSYHQNWAHRWTADWSWQEMKK